MSQTLSLPPPTETSQSVDAPFKRDPDTGLIVGKTYVFKPDGRIDWRALVDKKYLYIANEYKDRVVREQCKPLDQIDVLSVKDDWLRIRVGGLNELAHMRGVMSCTYPHFLSRDGYAAVSCEITFIGNVETNMYPETWSSTASATLRSVDKQFTPYLETFAENRAFIRCVKRALQINILSDIEIGGEGKGSQNGVSDGNDNENTSQQSSDTPSSPPQGFEARHRLQELCAAPPAPMKGPITFEAVKKAAAEYKGELQGDPAGWVSFESIQPIDAYVLIGKIKEKASGSKPTKGSKP